MQIKQHKTQKGIEIITDNFNSVQSVSLIIMIKAGGLDENIDNYGISHFLEHMAFKGTKTLNYKQIAYEFDIIGGYFSAYTTKDRTVFYVKTLRASLPRAIHLMADILLNSQMPVEEIEKERGVILQEIKQNDDIADNYIFDMYNEVAYKDQPLGWSLLGTEEFVKTVDKQQIEDYMDQFYTADNMIIAVSGNFDEQKTVDLLSKEFDGIKPSSKNRPNGRVQNVYTPGFRHKIQDIEQTHFILGYEGVTFNDPRFYTANIASQILGEGMSSRLFQNIREKYGLVYGISSFAGSYKDTGLFNIYAASNPEDVLKITGLITNEIEAASQEITSEELEVAKAQIKSAIIMAMESTYARADKMASNLLSYNHFIPLSQVRERIDEITTEDITSFFSDVILQSKPTFASIGNKNMDKVYKSLQDGQM